MSPVHLAGMHLSGKVTPMSEPAAPVSPESIIESVRFSRRPANMFCHAERLTIEWTNPDGEKQRAVEKSCKVCELDDLGHVDSGSEATILVAASVAPKVLAYVVCIPERVEGDPTVWDFDYQARIVLMPEPVAASTAEMLKSFSGSAAKAMLEGQGVFPAPIHEENIYENPFGGHVVVINLDPGDVSLP